MSLAAELISIPPVDTQSPIARDLNSCCLDSCSVLHFAVVRWCYLNGKSSSSDSRLSHGQFVVDVVSRCIPQQEHYHARIGLIT